jgi:2,3-bisphosphoglycerate-independent phosphoglycerate mutase
MKYVFVHGEGMADGPSAALGGKTPLQAASTPHMDGLARRGELGLAAVTVEGIDPRKVVGPMALFGFDQRKFQSGPASFEAASLGVALGEHDVAYRCSLVTVRAGGGAKGPAGEAVKKLSPQVVLDDPMAGGIDTEEAKELIADVNDQLGSETLQFYQGTDHRHLMVWVGGKVKAVTYDPGEVAGQPIGAFLPSGDGGDFLRKVMEAAVAVLRDHPVNDERRATGRKPANCLWLWGQGKALHLPQWEDRYHLKGAVVSVRKLIRGIGICAGLEAVNPDATAGGDAQEFERLAEAARQALTTHGFLYVHAELSPDIVRRDDVKAKVQVLEDFDRIVVGGVLHELASQGPFRLVLVCDRPQLIGQAQSFQSAPYALVDSGHGVETGHGRNFNEADAAAAPAGVRDAARLMARLIGKG